jgi:hypothetical protein
MQPTAESRRTGMSVAIHLKQVPSPNGSAGPSTEPGGGRRFGVGTASALVAGSVIGTGVFALPSALAVFGPISLVAFVLVTIGAVALAGGAAGDLARG